MTSPQAFTARHVARTRLTARLAQARVGLVWAGGGCGKSALAAELRDTVALPAIEARLDPGDGEPDRLVGRLRRALLRAGRSDALLAVTESIADPRAAVEAMVDALAAEPEPVLLVVDDVHHADAGAGRLLTGLAADLPAQHRLLLLGRVAPSGFQAPAGAATLGTSDLALSAEETMELGASLALTGDEAEALARATGGWAAALVLALGRLGGAADRAAELRSLTEQASLLAHLVRGLLADLDDADRAGVVQLAHLPLIAEDDELVRRARAAGLPLTRVRDGWWELAGGVQEYLAGIAPLDPAVARRAVRDYVSGGELRAAVITLLRAELPEEAAGLVADLSPERVDRLDFAELGALVGVLPDAAVARHPRLLLHYARACQPAAQIGQRAEALTRAAALTGEPGPLQREIAAERALDEIRDHRPEPAKALATAVLDAAGEQEAAARARALDALGRVAAFGGDFDRAEALLEASLVLARALHQQSWVAQTLLALADRVLYACGRHDLAVARIDELLAVLPGRSRYRAVTLSSRATMLIDSGRLAEAEATFAEMRRLAEAAADDRALGYLAWSTAQLASQRGDATGTIAALQAAEAHATEWFHDHPTGAELLAEAVDLLDRVDEGGLARRYLERARLRADEAPEVLALAEAAMLARSGDPVQARHALAALTGVQRRETWRVTLLDAFAAARANDADAGAVAARAFAAAADLGHPGLPFARERRVAESLRGLAAAAGADLPAAARIEILLIGRFAVLHDGHELAVPEGRPQALVKLVAISGGRADAEAVMDALWPGVAPDAARRGVRNVLHRMRTAGEELILRDGDALRLPEGARIDAARVERDARAALGAGDENAVARVLAELHGELLPTDHGATWSAQPRERMRLLHVELLDRLAEEVEGRGELDEALRLLEQAIALDPYDERRYLLAARILAAQGRRGRATQTLERGADAIRALGLPVPRAMLRLAERIGAAT